MDGHCRSPCTCERCIIFKQFDGFNFDGTVGKHQKRQNFPPIKILRYTLAIELWIKEHIKFIRSELHGNYLKCLHRESGHIQLYAIDKLCIFVESSNS